MSGRETTTERELLSAEELAQIARRHPRHENPDFEPASFAPIRRLLDEHATLTAELREARAEVERMRVALERIAGDEYWNGQLIARAALAAIAELLGGGEPKP